MTKYLEVSGGQNWGVFLEIICMLLEAVLLGQVVTFQFGLSGGLRFFKQVIGVTTGLSCACQLANIYLLGLDVLVMNALGSRQLVFKRFIDDILVVDDGSIEVDDLLALFSSFDDCIVVTFEHGESDVCTHFLDLEIDFTNPELVYRTYRKPACTYAYTPAMSCHAKSVLEGIVATEVVRLLRTNNRRRDFAFQIVFFAGKLIARGFDPSMIRRVACRYPWRHRNKILERRGKSSVKTYIVPFKLRFCEGAEQLGISGIMRSWMHLLDRGEPRPLRPVVCYTVAKNLFRERYSRFL